MATFYPLTIKEVQQETPTAVSILFDVPQSLENEFTFVAGQYITIKTTINEKEVRRAYSICASPNSQEFRIAIKAVSGGAFSVFAVENLKAGNVLEVSKPEGKFVLETSKNNTHNYLAIAAGSGITPIMAMIKAVLENEPQSTFTLIYSNKTPEETIFKADIEMLKNDFNQQFFGQYVFSRTKENEALFGRIDKGNINFVLNNKFKARTFHKAFLCGPEAMISTAKETLVSYGLPENNIYFELFTPSVLKTETVKIHEGNCEITIIVDDEETTFTTKAKTTLLTAALKEGLDAPYSCQGGICSSCMAKITEGHATMDKNSILTPNEVAEGLVLTCQAHPTTQKITVDYDDV